MPGWTTLGAQQAEQISARSAANPDTFVDLEASRVGSANARCQAHWRAPFAPRPALRRVGLPDDVGQPVHDGLDDVGHCGRSEHDEGRDDQGGR